MHAYLGVCVRVHAEMGKSFFKQWWWLGLAMISRLAVRSHGHCGAHVDMSSEATLHCLTQPTNQSQHTGEWP